MNPTTYTNTGLNTNINTGFNTNINTSLNTNVGMNTMNVNRNNVSIGGGQFSGFKDNGVGGTQNHS